MSLQDDPTYWNLIRTGSPLLTQQPPPTQQPLPTIPMFTHCVRCGRTLTNPASQRRGYGPICYGKVVAEARQEIHELHLKYDKKEN